MSFTTICDLHVLMRIHAWNRAKLAREIQNFGGKQSVQMASAKKQTNFHYYRQSKFITNTLAFTLSELSIWGDQI